MPNAPLGTPAPPAVALSGSSVAPAAGADSAAQTVVGTTLEAHLISGMRGTPGATGDFYSVLN
ncbi:MAG: hypothetical protein ACRENE_22740, partial [Polyangiaceae bacterium]